jgi:ribosomal protein L11 methyltransferase
MFSLEVECPPGGEDMLVAKLSEEMPAGIQEVAQGRLRVFFEDDARREALVDRFHAVSWREEEERDWIALARERWEPMEVGERFFLVPVWRDDPTPPGRFRIEINPGMAFGTGVHETTQLCIEALEMYLKPSMRLLDIGTGSGILAQAAQLLGAGAVVACDVDPVATAIAHDNLGPVVYTGSADAVRDAWADIVTANISAECVVALAPQWSRCLRQGGIALLSGFEVYEAAAVTAALERLGGVVRADRQRGNWILIIVSPDETTRQSAALCQ